MMNLTAKKHKSKTHEILIFIYCYIGDGLRQFSSACDVTGTSRPIKNLISRNIAFVLLSIRRSLKNRKKALLKKRNFALSFNDVLWELIVTVFFLNMELNEERSQMYMKTEHDLRTEIFYLKDCCCNISNYRNHKRSKTSRG